MKIFSTKRVALAVSLTLGVVLVLVLLGKPSHAQAIILEPESAPHQSASPTPNQAVQEKVQPNAPSAVAPYIVKDTDNDSPGTNIVTRIVTFTAVIGGTPAPSLQWKVDHGHGFEAIAGATASTLRIGNAQVSDTGSYSLFATNSAGAIQTTSQPITIIEGED